mmetsp:Transcript_62307/g.202025  ORF Transcript_62307/g.202025 Transcript_62307/m.202025 type:complete len:580 (+) Transcript_62307:51-1790(+)
MSTQPCHLRLSEGVGTESKYCGIVPASDGRLYCVPQDAKKLLVISPDVHSVEYVDLPFAVLVDADNAELAPSFSGIAEAPDGKLYFSADSWGMRADFRLREHISSIEADPLKAPDPSSWPSGWDRGFSVLVYDPGQKSFSHIYTVDNPPCSHDCIEFERGNLFGGIAAAPNGKLYCPPQSTVFVLVVDPSAQSISYIEGAGRASRRNNWSGIALGVDGLLYCSPQTETGVRVIDPESDSLHYMWDKHVFRAAGYGSWDEDDVDDQDLDLWSGIAAATNGKLYCSPLDSKVVLVIDPHSWSLGYIDGAGTEIEKWGGITAASDGRLYCAPFNSNHILVIDPIFEVLSWIEVPYPSPWGYEDKWWGVAADRGRLWCAPHSADTLLTMCLPKTDNSAFFRDPKHHDMALVTEDGSRVGCHRLFIKSASAVFERMLAGEFAEGKNAEVVVRGISASTLKAVVQHIYGGSVPKGVDHNELARVADAYGLDALQVQCLQSLVDQCRDGNEVVKVARVLRSMRAGECDAMVEVTDAWYQFKEKVLSDRYLGECALVALGDSLPDVRARKLQRSFHSTPFSPCDCSP